MKINVKTKDLNTSVMRTEEKLKELTKDSFSSNSIEKIFEGSRNPRLGTVSRNLRFELSASMHQY